MTRADAAALILQGQAMARSGRRREALLLAAQASTLRLDSPALLDALATLFSHCDAAEQALPLFERAVAAAPDDPAFLYNLATAQRMMGKLDAASASLERVLALRPNDYGAHYTRSDLRAYTRESNHVEEMLRLAASGFPSPQAEILLRFAVAKELEDIGEHSRSFEQLKRGCDLQRAAMSYDVAADVATIASIIQRFDAGAVAAPQSADGGEECIFVIGLPRSGTTLVESILAAHTEVFAAGELQALPLQAVQMVRELAGTVVPKLAFADCVLQVDAAELGRRYLADTRPQTGHTPRFVDKLPLNYLYAGLIRRALPKARIIALVRDPMDACYAMYKTLFTAAYPFSYDLGELGQYYRAWHRLMAHWRDVLGDALLLVGYEALVADPEAVSREIIRHAGLQWQEQCLDFQSRERAVTSASAAQVRRPIYSSSVGRWRCYTEQLAPLARQLGALPPLLA